MKNGCQSPGSFACIRQILDGPPQGVPLAGWWSRPFDPFKTHVPAVILAGKTIELWARRYASFEAMNAKETQLNTTYAPQWTKEGRGHEHRLSRT